MVTVKRTLLQQQLFLLFLLQAISVFGQGDVETGTDLMSGSPIDNLPSYVKLVSGFSERLEWSHDGSFILFSDNPMGEVYELELASGIIWQ